MLVQLQAKKLGETRAGAEALAALSEAVVVGFTSPRFCPAAIDPTGCAPAQPLSYGGAAASAQAAGAQAASAPQLAKWLRCLDDIGVAGRCVPSLCGRPRLFPPLGCVLKAIVELMGDEARKTRMLAEPAWPRALLAAVRAPGSPADAHLGARTPEVGWIYVGHAAVVPGCLYRNGASGPGYYKPTAAAAGSASGGGCQAALAPAFLALGKFDAAAGESTQPGGGYREQLVSAVLADPERWPVLTAIVPALQPLHDQLPAAWRHHASFRSLLRRGVEALTQKTGAPPPELLDWKLNLKINNGTAGCRQVNAFLADPMKKQEVFNGAEFVYNGYATRLLEALQKQNRSLLTVTLLISS